MDGVSMCNKELGIGVCFSQRHVPPWDYMYGALPGVWGEQGGGAFLQGKHGNKEHKKTNFRILGNRGTCQFI